MAQTYVCQDFLLFQDQLRKMRELDDKIVYALNVSIPTESFKHKSDNSASCSDLLKKIESNYDKRNTAIKECIAITADRVKTLKDERDANKNNTGNDSQFKTEQRKLRVLQSELNVEDIIRERTVKLLKERCARFLHI